MVTMACETKHRRCGMPCFSGCHIVGRSPRRCHCRPAGGPGRQDVVGRYYDPQGGQFLSVDPAVQQTQQAFVYVGDDPVNEIDASGLGSWWNPCSWGNVCHHAHNVIHGITSSSAFTWFNQNLNPAYMALMGYYNEWQAAENGEGISSEAEYAAEGVFGLLLTALTAAGGEALVSRMFAKEATPFAEDNLAHIFRNAPGHLAEDTPANRSLLQSAVRPWNYVGTDSVSRVATYRKLLSDGRQVWVEVRNGVITNGGINAVPRY